MKELSENLDWLIEKVKNCYNLIARRLRVQMYSSYSLDIFKKTIFIGLKSFIEYSRKKAIQTQLREKDTQESKERPIYGKKVPIDIESYLGGFYHFTIDEFLIKDKIAYLIESKHGILPNIEDVKDGLIKVMIFKAIDKLYLNNIPINFRVGLMLTSEINTDKSLYDAINSLKNQKVKKFYIGFLKEAKDNSFEVFFNEIN